MNPAAPTLNVGFQQQLVATPTTSGGRIVNREASWTTSNASVATVDANGMVTAVGGGTATITATAGGESGTSEVTVWFPVQSMTIAPAQGTIRQEGVTQIVPSFTDTQGQTATGRQVQWTSSNTAIATVSPTGRVTAKFGNDGSTTITGTTLLEGVVAQTVVDVSGPPQVVALTLAPANPTLIPGQMIQYAPDPRSPAGNVVPGVTYQWESGNGAVAAVSGTGLLTAVDVGETVITARALDPDGNVTRTSNVTVLEEVSAGAGQVIAAIADGDFLDVGLAIPAATGNVTVAVNATGGDIDLYMFAPNVVPGGFAGSTFAGFTCRPWLAGSNEQCSVNNPTAGTWRIRFHNFPDSGTAQNVTFTITITPAP